MMFWMALNSFGVATIINIWDHNSYPPQTKKPSEILHVRALEFP